MKYSIPLITTIICLGSLGFTAWQGFTYIQSRTYWENTPYTQNHWLPSYHAYLEGHGARYQITGGIQSFSTTPETLELTVEYDNTAVELTYALNKPPIVGRINNFNESPESLSDSGFLEAIQSQSRMTITYEVSAGSNERRITNVVIQ